MNATELIRCEIEPAGTVYMTAEAVKRWNDGDFTASDEKTSYWCRPDDELSRSGDTNESNVYFCDITENEHDKYFNCELCVIVQEVT